MTHDKPKVFIDLDEYNELKLKANEEHSKSEDVLCKEVIATLLNCKMDMGAALSALKVKKISLSVSNSFSGSITKDDIQVKQFNG